MPDLTTTRLLLRPWQPGDEDALVRYADNPNVARNLRDSFPHPYDRAAAERWVAYNATVQGPTLDFAITLDGEAIGGIGFLRNEDIFRCALELGYWLAEPFWGRGLVAEAIGAVVDYAFATFPEVTVVQARHVVSNPASGRVLLKAGFQLEGRLRDAFVKRGVVSDLLVYSLTRAENEQRKPPR
ncbi:MAG TPA: GNAT family protein [Thermoanaerobaculia bacterium]|nr:GNAT family protein [Thermoanaerobaculia bacterium]